MAKNSDVILPHTRAPFTWNLPSLYQAYATFILKNDLQCWGMYNNSCRMKNYWIYKTVTKGKDSKVVEVMSYPRWRAILQAFFLSARRQIIYEGKSLMMGELGQILAKRRGRNFSKPQVNRGATNRQPKVLRNGKMVPERTIYYTDDDYIRIGWRKYGRLAGEIHYAFKPCTGYTDRKKGKPGFKEEFSRANMADPNLKFKYQYTPYTPSGVKAQMDAA